MLEVMIYLSGDRSLARLEDPGRTIALGYPIGSPAGLIEQGTFVSGSSKGKPLSVAAKERFAEGK